MKIKELICVGSLAASIFTTGCDRLEDMNPGDTIKLDPFTYGDENKYRIDGCEITYIKHDRILITLSVFNDFDKNETDANDQYLKELAFAIGNVKDYNDWDVEDYNDQIELDFNGKTIYVELKNQYSAVELASMIGKQKRVLGKIKEGSSVAIRLYDSIIIPEEE